MIVDNETRSVFLPFCLLRDIVSKCPARVAGTRICGPGSGSRRVRVERDGGLERVVLCAGAGRAWVDKLFVRVAEC